MNWIAKTKSRGLWPGTPLLLCEPDDNRFGGMEARDTITFKAAAGGAVVLKVARVAKHEIVIETSNNQTWRLRPTMRGEPKSGFTHSGPSSEWTIRARSA